MNRQVRMVISLTVRHEGLEAVAWRISPAPQMPSGSASCKTACTGANGKLQAASDAIETLMKAEETRDMYLRIDLQPNQYHLFHTPKHVEEGH